MDITRLNFNCMKYNLLFFILFLIFISCTKDELVNNGNIQINDCLFFDDTQLMSNIDKYEIYVDSLIGQTKSLQTKVNFDLTPLSKKQAAKFYLLLDFYSKSNCEWVPCFVNKETNKIINTIDTAPDPTIYEKMSRESFYNLLRQDKVDIKLSKNKVQIKSLPMTKGYSDEGNYSKVFQKMEVASSKVLNGMANHYVMITWFIKQAYPGITLINPFPDVDRCDSYVDPFFGTYSQSGYSNSYNYENEHLYGDCAGTITISVSIVGLEIGTVHYVRTLFDFSTKPSKKS